MDFKEMGTDTQMTLFCEQDILDVFHTPLPISRVIPFERKVLHLCCYAGEAAQIQIEVLFITSIKLARKGNSVPQTL